MSTRKRQAAKKAQRKQSISAAEAGVKSAQDAFMKILAKADPKAVKPTRAN